MAALLPILLLATVQWRYEIAVRGPVLEVQAAFPSGTGQEFGVARGAEDFVTDVRVEGAPVARRDDAWLLPSCRHGCRVSYAFALGRAAEVGDPDVAMRAGETIESPPCSWLLHPRRKSFDALIRIQISSPSGRRFAVGLPPDDAADTYSLPASALPLTPYAAFGPLEVREVRIGDAWLQIALAPTERKLATGDLMDWISQQARAVAAYFGRLPVDHTLVLVLPAVRGIHGRTMGGGGATVLLWVGARVTQGALPRDWVLVHELVHTALPSLRYKHHWAEEGLATYVEPIIRARAGLVSDAQYWRELMEGLPKGLPGPGDLGLDGTPTWGRTYWGGALFWFLGDLGIRERTHDARSLDDALRAILASSGGMAARWPLDRVLRRGDGAVGFPALQDLHARMGPAPMAADLEALFGRLGVSLRDGEIAFDDRAPLASIRAAITAPRPSSQK